MQALAIHPHPARLVSSSE